MVRAMEHEKDSTGHWALAPKGEGPLKQGIRLSVKPGKGQEIVSLLLTCALSTTVVL